MPFYLVPYDAVLRDMCIGKVGLRIYQRCVYVNLPRRLAEGNTNDHKH
jgi:hypothetical protein